MVSKIPTAVSLFYRTGAIVSLERRISGNNFGSPEILPPRKDPTPNQDNAIIITLQDPNLPPNLVKGPTGHKPFIDDIIVSNDTENKHTDTIDNSRTDNKNYVDKINAEKD